MRILVIAKNLDDKIGPTAQIIKSLLSSKAFSKHNIFLYSEKKEIKLIKFYKKLIGKIYAFFSGKPAIMWNHKIIAKNLLTIIEKNNIDLIFAVAGSFNYFQALEYLVEKKKKKIPYLLYYADIFSTPESNSAYITMEKKWIDNCTLCIENCSHKKIVIDKFGCKTNIIFLEWPSVISFQNDAKKNFLSKFNCINFAYIGSFYYPHRGINELLAFIKSVSSKIDCCFFLVGTNILDFIQKSELPRNIVLKDRLPANELGDFLCKMDFLINIENSSSLWLPSKLIQYLQCNKPIINIGTNDYSICKEYLAKYSACFFNYFSNRLDTELIKFIEKNYNKIIQNKCLERFNKEYIAEKILNELEKRL